MRWMIWPRQYGKTFETCRWFMEDPVNRVILTGSEDLARERRHALEQTLIALGPPPHMITEWRRLLRTHVVSFRAWQRTRGRFPPGIKIAVDGLEEMTRDLFGGSVEVITGTGRNAQPNPAIAAKAEEMHAKFAHLIPEEFRDL